MIHIPMSMLIPLPSKKFGPLQIHQFAQVLTDALFDLYTDHLKNILRLLLDFLENIYKLRYANFYLHGCFSFLMVFFAKTLLKEKRPFFTLF